MERDYYPVVLSPFFVNVVLFFLLDVQLSLSVLPPLEAYHLESSTRET